MSVMMKGHIGFGSKGGEGALYFDMSHYATSKFDYSSTQEPAETSDGKNNDALGYVPWGDDNLLPQKMIDDIQSCGVLEGAIDGKARFGLGQGIRPMLLGGMDEISKSELLTPLNDAEINDWMEANNLFEESLGWFRDHIGLGQDLARLKFDKAGEKIGYCIRHDISEMRYSTKVGGRLTQVQLSGEWRTGGGGKEDRIKLPLLPRYGTAAFLEEMDAGKRKGKEFAMVCRRPTNDKHYYSNPGWFSARGWVAIAKGVPEMKAAIFKNAIRLKYVVIIHEEYWTRTFEDWEEKAELQEKRRTDLYDEIDSFLTGSKNAYKSIFVDGHTDPHLKERYPDIEFKPIEDNTKPGELLPDSAAANSEILFPLMMNPALMGADTPGGPYSGGAGSGSNIREAAWVQVMIQEYERNCIIQKMNLVSRINGWKQRHPTLVWRFPALVLTTLDTGRSTEDVTTGSGK